MDGVLLRAKPAGVTSHDVVAEVRRSLPRGTKVGHAGTLDPFATGLLLILVGRATRAQRFLMELPKTYRAVARLGWTSTTGRPRRRARGDRADARSRSRSRSGAQLQTPPAYSAVKVGGRRAYELARAGETPELTAAPDHGAPRRPAVARGRPRRVRDRVLVRHLRALARNRPGRRLLRGARAHRHRPVPAGGRPDPSAWSPLREALAFMPERRCRPRRPRRCGTGAAFPAGASGAEHLRLTHEGEILAIGEPRRG